jgi:hypothetical protein
VRALVPIVVLVLAAHARADELDEARQLEASLEYERALVVVDHAIARGGSDAARLAQLHFEAGKLAAGLDHAAAAADHFARALALDPTVALPAGASPKLVEPFEAARRTSRPLRIELGHEGRRVSARADDPLHLVASVRASDARGGGTTLETRDGTPYVLELPASISRVHVVALDDHGNQLFAGEQELELPPVLRPQPHWYARWPVWAATTGVVLAGGGLCAWRFSVAQDDWNQLRSQDGQHDYSQLRALEDRGRAWALAANIGFGVAAAGAVITAIAYVRAPNRDAPISVTAGPGTVGVAGRF